MTGEIGYKNKLVLVVFDLDIQLGMVQLYSKNETYYATV